MSCVCLRDSTLIGILKWVLELLSRKIDHGLEHTVLVGGREIEGGLALFEVKAVGNHDVHVELTTLHHVERRLYTVILTTYILDADFFVAQLVLLAVTRLRGRIYEKRHNGEVLQQALEGGNSALAIRYMGHLMSAAFGVKAASGLIAYHSLALVGLIFNWLFVALVITAAQAEARFAS